MSKVVVAAQVVRVNEPLPVVMGPRSIMYMTAGLLVTGTEVPQPRYDVNHDVEPKRVVFTVKLEVKPVDTLEPRVGGAGHEVHTEDVVALTTDEKVPVAHDPVHAAVVRPVVAPQVPAGQGVQAAVGAPPIEYEPAGHTLVQVAAVKPTELP